MSNNKEKSDKEKAEAKAKAEEEEEAKAKAEEEAKAKQKVKKTYRLLKNPNQTAESQNYFNEKNVVVTVPKSGYHFSMDKEMDATVEYFKKELGFIEVV